MYIKDISVGDILYNPETGAIVKVSNKEDDLLSFSACTPADSLEAVQVDVTSLIALRKDPRYYVPATERQRELMYRKITYLDYLGGKKDDKHLMALGYLVAELRMENESLVRRVHDLVDDYNTLAKKRQHSEIESSDAINMVTFMRRGTVCPFCLTKEKVTIGTVACYNCSHYCGSRWHEGWVKCDAPLTKISKLDNYGDKG